MRNVTVLVAFTDTDVPAREFSSITDEPIDFIVERINERIYYSEYSVGVYVRAGDEEENFASCQDHILVQVNGYHRHEADARDKIAELAHAALYNARIVNDV